MAAHGLIWDGVKWVASAIGSGAGPIASAVTQVGFAGVEALMQGTMGGGASSTADGGTGGSVFREGADMRILSQAEAAALANGHPIRKRRRRRKLLTCGDKADIAFLHGNLGGGQLGRAAISSLLSRRCS